MARLASRLARPSQSWSETKRGRSEANVAIIRRGLEAHSAALSRKAVVAARAEKQQRVGPRRGLAKRLAKLGVLIGSSAFGPEHSLETG
jgi:hypothetical protein